MNLFAWLTVGLATLDIVALVVLFSQRRLMRERIGRVSFLLAALALPAICLMASAGVTVERSKQVEFCQSCHEMGTYVESLAGDDDEILAAVHAQNNLVPPGQACYVCHTDYTMFGPIEAKLTGLKHVYVHYLGKPPEKIELYQPYDSGNCLHCHEGSRRFLNAKGHKRKAEVLDDVRSGSKSCLDSGCHEYAHHFPEDDE